MYFRIISENDKIDDDDHGNKRLACSRAFHAFNNYKT